MEAYTIKGIDAAREIIELLKSNHSRVAMLGTVKINPLSNYYIYHWLLTSSEYVFSPDIECFVPNENFSNAEIKSYHNSSISFGITDEIGKIANSLGLSMSSLEEIFTEKNLEYELLRKNNGIHVKFTEKVNGDEADFMYITFPEMNKSFEYALFYSNAQTQKKYNKYAKYLMRKDYNPGLQVKVSWSDDHEEIHDIVCDMGEGKLLIPLGAGVKWLLHGHDYLDIQILENGEEVNIPTLPLPSFRFLKLREVIDNV